MLILLALQLPSGCFFFNLLFTVGFYSPRLREVLAVSQLDLQSWMKSSSGGGGIKKKLELVGNWISLPYNYNKNARMWVVSTARESVGVSIVMVNSQRGGGVCSTQRGSPSQWTGPAVKWDVQKSGNLLAIRAAFVGLRVGTQRAACCWSNTNSFSFLYLKKKKQSAQLKSMTGF